MTYTLTPNAVMAMYHDLQDDPGYNQPVVQVLNIRKIAKAADPSKGSVSVDRYRLLLSDGTTLAQAMLATQANPTLEDSGMDKNSIVRINEFSSNVLKNAKTKKLIIILSMEVLNPGAGLEKMGEPVNLDESAPPPTKLQQSGVKDEDAMDLTPDGPKNSAQDVKPKIQQQQLQQKSVATTATKKPGGNSVNARGAGGQAIFPIESLNPYHNKWMIKARVTTKSDIKRFSNARGEGKLFSMVVMDHTGEIKCTAFGDAVDTFFPKVEEGKVILISNARIVMAKKNFNYTKNDYEITLDRGAMIEPCDDTDVPQVKFEFITLAELEEKPKDSIVDVLGVLKEAQPVSTIVTKVTQKEMKKRELLLVDRTGYQVRVTLWGRQAESFPENIADEFPVVAFKGLRVGDFGGRSLSYSAGSTMVVDPDITEAHSLRGWWERDGKAGHFRAYTSTGGGGGSTAVNFNDTTQLKTAAQVREETEAAGDDTPNATYNLRAMVNYIKPENIWYAACPSDNCNKKVDMEGDDQWKCEKCNKTYPKPQYRYIMGFSVSDYTDTLWLTGFNEAGEMILGKTANEMQEIWEMDVEHTQFKKEILKCLGKWWFFQIKSKTDSFKENTRIRYTVAKLLTPSFETVALKLVDELENGWDVDVEMK